MTFCNISCSPLLLANDVREYIVILEVATSVINVLLTIFEDIGCFFGTRSARGHMNFDIL